MTNSTSNGSKNRLLGAVVVCAVLVAAGVAHADRKRVVVLDFEGPKAEKFHDDLVRLIKKTHSIVSTDRWNGAAAELDAAAISDRNIKRVANKLKVDAVIEGKIEKRRDDFLIRLKLHHGKSGELVGNPVATKAEGPRIDGRAQREIQDELIAAIEQVESSHAGVVIEDDDEPPAKKTAKKIDDEDQRPARKGKKAEDDEDERPAKKGKKAEDEDERPAKKGKKAEDDEGERPAKKGFAKLSEDERGADRVDRKGKKVEDDEDRLPPKKANKLEDEGERPAKKGAKKTEGDDKLVASKSATRPAAAPAADDEPARPVSKVERRDDSDGRKPRKRVAVRDEDSAEVDVDGPPLDDDTALSPAERALEAVAGVSVTMRRMSFAYRADLAARPGGYKGRPVGGAMLDVTLYPRAWSHKRGESLKNLGINVLYDRVLFINSRDPATGIVYATKESRYRVGALYRHAFSDSPGALVVAGTLSYSGQLFTIAGMASIPSVKYSILEPGAALRYPLTSKLTVGLDARLLVVLGAGPIADQTQYGDTSALGAEAGLSVDYLVTRNLFARAAVRAETLRLKFKGNGDQATMRDGDPMTQDVSGARDNYLGALLTAGYLY